MGGWEGVREWMNWWMSEFTKIFHLYGILPFQISNYYLRISLGNDRKSLPSVSSYASPPLPLSSYAVRTERMANYQVHYKYHETRGYFPLAAVIKPNADQPASLSRKSHFIFVALTVIALMPIIYRTWGFKSYLQWPPPLSRLGLLC